MQQAEASSAGLRGLSWVFLRAACIFVGGTTAGYLLVTDVGNGADPGGTDPGSYPRALWHAVRPGNAMAQALANTAVLVVAATLLGALLGAAFGGLLRVRRIGSALGYLVAPMLALAVPGVVLFPLAYLLGRSGIIPTVPVTLEQSVGDSLRFVGFWAAAAGLAIAPAVASMVAGTKGRAGFGSDTAMAALAARPEPRAAWRFGFPTTVLLLAVAGAEMLSGHPGLFRVFAGGLRSGDLEAALDVLFLVVIGGALFTIAFELVAAVLKPGADRPEPAGVARSPLAVPLLLLLMALAAIAGVGLAIDGASTTATAPPAAGLAGPTWGGPWLGTDRIGRSLLAVTAGATGPALVSALVPGLAATVVGSGMAAARRALPPWAARVLGALIDLLWWPVPLLIPLLLVSVQSSARPELHPAYLGLTGLALVPLAGRLVERTVLAAGTDRWPRAAAVWLQCSALALAAYLLAGFMGLAGGDRPNLGQLMADGVIVYPDSPWSFLVPAIVTVSTLCLLYWLAAAVTVPAPVTVVAPVVEAQQRSEVPYPITEPMILDEDTIRLGPVADLTPQPVPGPAPGVGDAGSPVEVSADWAVDAEPAGTEPGSHTPIEHPDFEFSDIAAEASRTIELRPSTLRSMGQPSQPLRRQKPILASRTSETVSDYSSQDPDQQPDRGPGPDQDENADEDADEDGG